MANVNVVYGSTGERSMFMGMDLTCDMGVAHALGERPPVEKELKRPSKKFTVRDLLMSEKGLSYDLMLRMMMDEGVVDYNTTVEVVSDGRLREVYNVKTKTAYRMFGKTYYGKV